MSQGGALVSSQTGDGKAALENDIMDRIRDAVVALQSRHRIGWYEIWYDLKDGTVKTRLYDENNRNADYVSGSMVEAGVVEITCVYKYRRKTQFDAVMCAAEDLQRIAREEGL